MDFSFFYVKRVENILYFSKYYKKLNSLLNNPDLIKFLKDSGYVVIFKPHPNLNEYVHLFDFNEYVKLGIIEKDGDRKLHI